MTTRKLIRPETEPRTGRGVRRKQVPPEQTNAEEFYYLKQMAARTPMVVVLRDGGEELQGWIEWYDKSSIKLNRTNGPNLLLPKHSIRYMFKEEELKRFKRRDRRGPSTSRPSQGDGDGDQGEDGESDS